MLRRKSLAAFLAVMSIASFASAAATISILPQLGQSFSGNVATSGPFTSLGNGLVFGATLCRVDVFASVSGASANEAFGATSFDASTSGGLSIYAGNISGSGTGLTTQAQPTWTASNPLMADVGDANGTPLTTFTVASDAGTAGDFITITNAIDQANLGKTFALDTGNPITDPRLMLGKTVQVKLGALWVVPGTTTGILNLTNATYMIADANTNQLVTPAVNITVPRLVIPTVPEPATIATMGIGAFILLVVKLRRHIAA